MAGPTFSPPRRTRAPGWACLTSASGSKRALGAAVNVASARPPTEAMSSRSRCRSKPVADQGPLKVLIADDEPLAAERLQLLLARSQGAALVGTASDGESAV